MKTILEGLETVQLAITSALAQLYFLENQVSWLREKEVNTPHEPSKKKERALRDLLTEIRTAEGAFVDACTALAAYQKEEE